MVYSSIYTDQGGSASGTPLNAANLNTAVSAAAYLISGGYPASVSSSSLAISQPATAAVVQSSSTAVQYVQMVAQTITIPSSPTGVWYVDLTVTGAYTLTQSATVAATSLRLYQVHSSGTGLTDGSAISVLAPEQPLRTVQVQGDLTEAATNDALLPATTTLQNNLNRIRFMIGQMVGGTWSSAVQMIPLAQKAVASGVASLDANSHVLQQPVSDATEASTLDTLGATSTTTNNFNRIRNQLGVVIGGTGASWNSAVQMLPLSQKGAISGVPSLDAAGHVTQYPVTGVRQKKAITQTTDLTGLSAATWTTWPGSEFTALTLPSSVLSPGKVVVRLFISAANFSTGAASLQFRLNINSGAVLVYLGQHQWPTAGGAVEAFSMLGLHAPIAFPFTLSNLTLEYQISGAGPNFQVRIPQSTYPWAAMVMELEECA